MPLEDRSLAKPAPAVPPVVTPVMASAAGDDLLLQLYGACGEAARWRAVLDRVAAELDAHSVVVQGLRLQAGRLSTSWLAHDSDIDLDAYRTSISDEGNARIDSRRFAWSAGRIVDDSELFSSSEEGVRTRLQQKLAAIGMGPFLGGLLLVQPGQYVSVAVHRHRSDGRGYSTRQRDRLAQLMPHLAQAQRLSEAMASSRTAQSMLQGPLDNWPCGLMVCEADGLVRWMNRRAATAMASGHGLSVIGNRLAASGLAAQQRLSQALHQAGLARRPAFVTIDSRGHAWRLALQPLDDAAGSGDPAVLLTISDDAAGGDIPLEAFCQLFGLTDAEARLAQALVAGCTVEAYAQRKGVAVGTVRCQLRQVLAKTGTDRQADLVRRVLCSAAASSAGAAAARA